MRKLGLLARRPKRFDRFRIRPAIAENALDRKFEASQPNRVWSTDITYVWTREGWLYLAIIIDLFSRRVVGWATANHMRTFLVLPTYSSRRRRQHIETNPRRRGHEKRSRVRHVV